MNRKGVKNHAHSVKVVNGERLSKLRVFVKPAREEAMSIRKHIQLPPPGKVLASVSTTKTSNASQSPASKASSKPPEKDTSPVKVGDGLSISVFEGTGAKAVVSEKNEMSLSSDDNLATSKSEQMDMCDSELVAAVGSISAAEDDDLSDCGQGQVDSEDQKESVTAGPSKGGQKRQHSENKRRKRFRMPSKTPLYLQIISGVPAIDPEILEQVDGNLDDHSEEIIGGEKSNSDQSDKIKGRRSLRSKRPVLQRGADPLLNSEAKSNRNSDPSTKIGTGKTEVSRAVNTRRASRRRKSALPAALAKKKRKEIDNEVEKEADGSTGLTCINCEHRPFFDSAQTFSDHQFDQHLIDEVEETIETLVALGRKTRRKCRGSIRCPAADCPLDFGFLHKADRTDHFWQEHCEQIRKDVVAIVSRYRENGKFKVTKSCAICEATFTTVRDLSVHVSEQHPEMASEFDAKQADGKQARCIFCDKNFASDIDCLKHKLSMHAEDMTICGPGKPGFDAAAGLPSSKLVCVRCGKRFDNNDQLIEHSFRVHAIWRQKTRWRPVHAKPVAAKCSENVMGAHVEEVNDSGPKKPSLEDTAGTSSSGVLLGARTAKRKAAERLSQIIQDQRKSNKTLRKEAYEEKLIPGNDAVPRKDHSERSFEETVDDTTGIEYPSGYIGPPPGTDLRETLRVRIATPGAHWKRAVVFKGGSTLVGHGQEYASLDRVPEVSRDDDSGTVTTTLNSCDIPAPTSEPLGSEQPHCSGLPDLDPFMPCVEQEPGLVDREDAINSAVAEGFDEPCESDPAELIMLPDVVTLADLGSGDSGVTAVADEPVDEKDSVSIPDDQPDQDGQDRDPVGPAVHKVDHSAGTGKTVKRANVNLDRHWDNKKKGLPSILVPASAGSQMLDDPNNVPLVVVNETNLPAPVVNYPVISDIGDAPKTIESPVYRRYMCPICRQFVYGPLFWVHSERCMREMQPRQADDRHRLVHCALCRQDVLQSGFLKHLRKLHDSVAVQCTRGPLVCPRCGLQSFQWSELYAHFIRVCANEACCPFCGQLLREHEQSGMAPSERTTAFQCCNCCKTLETREALQAHSKDEIMRMFCNTELSPERCDTCAQVFVDLPALARHRQLVH